MTPPWHQRAATFIYRLGAHGVLRPLQPCRGFYLSGFALPVMVWLWPAAFTDWPGHVPFARDSAATGAGRFLIDAALPLGLAYLLVVLACLRRSRLAAVNAAIDGNPVHPYPLLGAVVFFTQFPYFLFAYEPRQDWVYALSGSTLFLAYCMPWFAYLFANSFAVLLARGWRWRQARAARIPGDDAV